MPIDDLTLLRKASGRKPDLDSLSQLFCRYEIALIDRLMKVEPKPSEDRVEEINGRVLSQIVQQGQTYSAENGSVAEWIFSLHDQVIAQDKKNIFQDFPVAILHGVSTNCPLPKRRDPLPPCLGPCPLLVAEQVSDEVKPIATKLGLRPGSVDAAREKCRAIAVELLNKNS